MHLSLNLHSELKFASTKEEKGIFLAKDYYLHICRGGSRTAATCKMERFVIIVNYYHKALHLARCSSPRSASAFALFRNSNTDFNSLGNFVLCDLQMGDTWDTLP